MLNIPWLYHSTKHEDLELETLRQELVRFFEERFLILVDAVYLCLIDQDTTKTAKWDQYKGGVRAFSHLNILSLQNLGQAKYANIMYSPRIG